MGRIFDLLEHPLSKCDLRQGSGVEWIVPVMIHMVVFNWASTWCVWDDLDQTGAHYSAAENARVSAEVCSVGSAVRHFEPASLQSRLFLDFTFLSPFLSDVP